jgi:lipoprotein-anchoring transpeptidase ErfK/SrfK
MLMRVAPGVLAGLLLMVPMLQGPALAQATWVNGQPVFESDRRAAERRAAERRESYRTRYPANMSGGARPSISPEAPERISFPNGYGAGSIVIDTGGRKLYYVLSSSMAYQYPISVGRQGFTWYGTEKVSRMQSWPSWTPPAAMRRRQPYLPVTMSGGIRNPLGAKAIYLGNTLYRIHGTNDVRSIGRASSSGCFRMMNKHVLHLARLVQIGAPVHVVRSLDVPVSQSGAGGSGKRDS